MSLKNKLIRFCNATGTEELGIVASDQGTHYLIRQRLKQEGIEKSFSTYFRKTSTKVLEIYPFQYSRVEWRLGWANDPELVIKMTKEDHENTYKNMVYECKHDHYWAENQGICSFYYYIQPGPGFGGRTFTLNMKDGSKKDLIGPWSSGYHNTNKWFPECTSCTIEVYGESERPSRYAGHIRTHLAKALLPPGIQLYSNNDKTAICPSLSPEKVKKPNDNQTNS